MFFQDILCFLWMIINHLNLMFKDSVQFLRFLGYLSSFGYRQIRYGYLESFHKENCPLGDFSFFPKAETYFTGFYVYFYFSDGNSSHWSVLLKTLWSFYDLSLDQNFRKLQRNPVFCKSM